MRESAFMFMRLFEVAAIMTMGIEMAL